jgi:hypothetical protein
MREECHASFKEREKEIILRGPKNQTDFIKLCSAFLELLISRKKKFIVLAKVEYVLSTFSKILHYKIPFKIVSIF